MGIDLRAHRRWGELRNHHQRRRRRPRPDRRLRDDPDLGGEQPHRGLGGRRPASLPDAGRVWAPRREGIRFAGTPGAGESVRVLFPVDAARAFISATMRHRSLSLAMLCALAFNAAPLLGQEPGAPVEHKTLGPADIIMPHITDSKRIELPCIKGVQEWACEWTLPTWNVTVGGYTIDIGPTKHVVFMILAAILVGLFVVLAARSHARSTAEIGRPRGFAAGLEAVILYLRNDIFMPVLGGHG